MTTERDDETHDENTDDGGYYRRELTPTRVLQVKFVGFVNALYNYLQWLITQEMFRNSDKKDGEK